MTDFIKVLMKFKENAKDYIFTVKCPFCQKVIDKSELACPICRAKLPQTSIVDYAVGGYKCVSAPPYKDIFKDAVFSFKFRGNGTHAKRLAYLISLSIKEEYENNEFDLVTCVPMHKKQLKKRGYNQAELLARECADYLQIEYADLLEKYKENQPQHKTKANKRTENVKGVYRICDKNLVCNKNILIVDDIITTGNTLGECARILKNAGSKSVSCAALCAAIKGIN